MPLPTSAELTDPNATNAEMKQRLGQLVDQVVPISKNAALIETKGLKKSADASNVAFVVDAVGNILFGFDTLNDKPIIANLDKSINSANISNSIFSSDALRSLKKAQSTANIAFAVDSAGSILIGYDAVNDKPIIANIEKVTLLSKQPKKAFDKKLLSKSVNHMLFYGQSLSLGATATTILSTTQPYSNLTFNTGPRMDSLATSVIPLVEKFNNPSSDGMTNRGETPCSGAANYATKLSREQNSQDHVIFASTAGHGGYSIAELEKGTAWYAFMTSQTAKAFELNGSDFKTQVVNWAQGEADITDATSYATYLSKLKQLQVDMSNDIKAITTQTDSIPFIIYQCSYGTALNKDIALAQLKLVQENPMFFMSTATYRCPYYVGDSTHLTNIGYKLLGAYFGRAYKQLIIDNRVPDFINPLNAKIVGNTIELTFDVPTLPLKLDVTTLAAATNYGFKVNDLSNNNVAIASIAAEKNKVIITLVTTPTFDLKVRYALDYLGAGLNIINGASGNLIDSTTDAVVINSTTYTLFHVCPHFELTAYASKGI